MFSLLCGEYNPITGNFINKKKNTCRDNSRDWGHRTIFYIKLFPAVICCCVAAILVVSCYSWPCCRSWRCGCCYCVAVVVVLLLLLLRCCCCGCCCCYCVDATVVAAAVHAVAVVVATVLMLMLLFAVVIAAFCCCFSDIKCPNFVTHIVSMETLTQIHLLLLGLGACCFDLYFELKIESITSFILLNINLYNLLSSI